MIGHSIDDMTTAATQLMSKVKGLTFDDALKYLSGTTTMNQTIPMVGQTMNMATFGKASKPIGRFAGSQMGRGIARTIPGISAAVNLLDVADVVAGGDSLGNKVMDTAGMAIGGGIGAVIGGGPLGASIGASTGKAISDGVQGLFGGGKSAEERKMEEMIRMLQNRG